MLEEQDLSHRRKQTKRERFLAEMDAVIPWARLVPLIEPYYPRGGSGRKPMPLERMLRIHFSICNVLWPVMPAPRQART